MRTRGGHQIPKTMQVAGNSHEYRSAGQSQPRSASRLLSSHWSTRCGAWSAESGRATRISANARAATAFQLLYGASDMRNER